MPQVEELALRIAELDLAEREQLMKALESRGLTRTATGGEESALVVSTPDVCGGSARLAGTRIPVWTLVRMRQLGMSEADILRSYPSLRALDLVRAWSHADNHQDEIERDIRENEEE